MKYTEVDEHNKEQQKGVILYMSMSIWQCDYLQIVCTQDFLINYLLVNTASPLCLVPIS